ncbi:hypothetical protein DVP71_13820 [Yersinia enterocolitica]|nr:hypothetical protein [Yersinia enterocolitica]EKN5921385.1 hypothetical protein [Yersinia enterocolitica]EKN6269829.1 hypothetical protein [Yersinia enterocolitica]
MPSQVLKWQPWCNTPLARLDASFAAFAPTTNFLCVTFREFAQIKILLKSKYCDFPYHQVLIIVILIAFTD